MKNTIAHSLMRFVNTRWMLLCFLPLAAGAQEKHHGSNYQIWLRNQNHSIADGYLHQLSDSTLTLSTSRNSVNPDLRVFPVEQVEVIKYRKRGSIARGILSGALVGLFAGFGYGLMQGDDPPCKSDQWVCVRFSATQKGMFYSAITVPAGALVGGIIGSFKTEINIGGSRSEYARQREQLERFRQ